MDANTSLNYAQLTATQAALPCTLWATNGSGSIGCGRSLIIVRHCSP